MAALPLRKPSYQADEIAPLSVDQYHRMIAEGILEDGAPLELLDGVLVWKDRGGGMTVSPRHRLVVTCLMRLAARLEGSGAHLQIQSPVTIKPRHEPEPDAAVVLGEPSDYLDRHPQPGEVSSVIEVADSSLERDRTWKHSVYASAGIPQYVLINLAQGRIEVWESPDLASGRYRENLTLTKGAELEILLPGGRRLAQGTAELLPDLKPRPT